MSVFIESIDVTLSEELAPVSDLVVIHKVIYFQDHRIGSSVSAMSEKINKNLSCTRSTPAKSHWEDLEKVWNLLETFLWNGDPVELKSSSTWAHLARRICNSFGVNTYRWPSSRTAAQEMNDSLKVPSHALLFFLGGHSMQIDMLKDSRSMRVCELQPRWFPWVSSEKTKYQLKRQKEVSVPQRRYTTGTTKLSGFWWYCILSDEILEL